MVTKYLLVSSLVIVSSQLAWAFKAGSVEVDGAELKDGPGDSYKTVETLSRGTRFNASDNPKNDYYSVRTAKSTGWVKASSLGFGAPAAPSAPAKPAAAKFLRGTVNEASELRDGPTDKNRVLAKLPVGTKVNAATAQKNGFYYVRARAGTGWVKADALQMESDGGTPAGKTKARASGSSAAYKTYGIAVFGGLGFSSNPEIGALVGADIIKGNVAIGGQFSYSLSPDFAVALRFESISNKTQALDGATPQNTIEFSVSATPIQLGGEYTFYSTNSLWMNFGLFVGTATASFTTTVGTLAAPNVTTYSGSLISILPKVSLGADVGSGFSLFGELGFRIAQSSAAAPTLTGNGGNIYQVNGDYVNLPVNVGGLVTNAGLSYRF